MGGEWGCKAFRAVAENDWITEPGGWGAGGLGGRGGGGTGAAGELAGKTSGADESGDTRMKSCRPKPKWWQKQG